MRQLALLPTSDATAFPVVWAVIQEARARFGRVTDQNRQLVGQWCMREVDARLKAHGAAVDRPAKMRQAWAELTAAAAQHGGVDDTPAF